MSKRILVLTSSTGSGHDMRAIAFEKWIRVIHGNDPEIRIEQIIENASLLGQFGVWIYNTIQRFAPFLHNIYFFIVELLIFTHSKSVSFGGTYYRKLLQEYRPDLILSVHDSTNRGYFEDAKRILGESVRCVTYCGEFSGGYGYSRNWICPAVDLFIARTNRARDYAVDLGLPRNKTAVFHKFLPPESFQNSLSDQSKEAYLTQIGLDPAKFTVFLATGGFGANHHVDFLNVMLPLADRIQVILICGRNKKVLEKVIRWKSDHESLVCHIEGFSNKVADFMQVADAVVTRGGANTTMEALHFDCPMLYNSLGGLMPQEMCTVRYFLDAGAAKLIRSARDLPKVLQQWQDFGEPYESVKTRLRELHLEEDPRDLINLILGDHP